MQIIKQFFMTPADYIAQYDSIRINRPEKCPKCGVPNSFYAHGSYWRNVLTENVEERIPVARFCCKVCNLTVSMLPSFVLPYFQYSLEYITAALKLIFSAIKPNFSLTALYRFYRHRFYLNLNLIELFFREQWWTKPSPPDTHEKAIKIVCMLVGSPAETFSQKFHQQYKRNFMAH